MIQIPVQSNCCNLQNDFRGKMMGSRWLSIGRVDVIISMYNIAYRIIVASKELLKTPYLQPILQNNIRKDVIFVNYVYSIYLNLHCGGVYGN